MSTQLGTIEDSGSRNVRMYLVRYYGGVKNGVCIQLTAEQEDGRMGYVQLNMSDMAQLLDMYEEHVVDWLKERER
jgi:hypothetical protein